MEEIGCREPKVMKLSSLLLVLLPEILSHKLQTHTSGKIYSESKPVVLSRRSWWSVSTMGDVVVPPNTLPGVTYGSDSGSMFGIPFQGTPGWNSETEQQQLGAILSSIFKVFFKIIVHTFTIKKCFRISVHLYVCFGDKKLNFYF